LSFPKPLVWNCKVNHYSFNKARISQKYFRQNKESIIFSIRSQSLYQDLIASFRDSKSPKARFFLPLQKNESYGFTT